MRKRNKDGRVQNACHIERVKSIKIDWSIVVKPEQDGSFFFKKKILLINILNTIYNRTRPWPTYKWPTIWLDPNSNIVAMDQADFIGDHILFDIKTE
jgi:hypothetical protein